tara:strand:+ start:3769 stop:5100 length:1332 start_codon:yes stop_codon:yes gene_type:complete
MRLLIIEDGNELVEGFSKDIAGLRSDIEIKGYPYADLRREHGRDMAIAGISHSVLQDQVDAMVFFNNKDWYPGLISQFTCMNIQTILVEQLPLLCNVGWETSILITNRPYTAPECEILMGAHAEKFSDPIHGPMCMLIQELDAENLHKTVAGHIPENIDSMTYDEIHNNFNKLASNSLNNKFGELWKDNLAVNISNIHNSVSELKDAHEAWTGYVVSNGPSLKKFLDGKYTFCDRNNPVVVVNGAYRELTEAGHEIDYLHIVHPEDNQYERQIKGVTPVANVKLLVSSTIHPSTYAGWNQDMLYWYHAYNNDELLEDYKQLDLPLLSGGVSISPLAAGFLLHAGCDKIVFIGQDFAYSRLEKYHGVPLKPSEAYSGPTYVAEDLNGNMTLTTKTMERSKDAIVQLSLHYDGENGKRKIEFINASEEGILFGGNVSQAKLCDIF